MRQVHYLTALAVTLCLGSFAMMQNVAVAQTAGVFASPSLLPTPPVYRGYASYPQQAMPQNFQAAPNFQAQGFQTPGYAAPAPQIVPPQFAPRQPQFARPQFAQPQRPNGRPTPAARPVFQPVSTNYYNHGNPSAPVPVPEVYNAASYGSFDDALSGETAYENYNGDGYSCGGCDLGCRPCCPWFGSVGALIMTRDRPNGTWLSAESTNFTNQVQNSRDANGSWSGGGEARLGYRFGCCGNAIEFIYWGLDPIDDFSEFRVPGVFLNTPIDLNNVTIGAQNADVFFDGSPHHTVRRRDEVHNFEINLLRFPLCRGCGGEVTWLAGFRYFRLREDLNFGAVQTGFNFGDNGGVNEAYYNIDTENNLFGGQIGVYGSYRFSPRWSVYATPKLGAYANYMEQHQRLYRGDGLVGFDQHGNETDISFIGSLDFGINWDFSSRWSAYLGYRIVSASGVALTDNQIPNFLQASDELSNIETNGSLLLHGAVAGIGFNY